MKTNFVVQTSSFEGPLDVLLTLIKKRQLYINDISLARVTADYIQFITEHQETIDNKAEFVGIASTLILAKSRSLLPKPNIEEDDEISELEDRLRAYKLVKEQGEVLANQFGTSVLLVPQPTSDTEEVDIFAPGTGLTKELLATAAAAAVISLPEESLPTANIETTISLEEEIGRLQQRCREVSSLLFSSAVRSKDKRDQVVLFVAVLELIKGGIIEATQSKLFSDITLQSLQTN